MFFIIGESLQEVSREQLKNTDKQYVAVVSFDEWKESRDSFEMGIDMDQDISEMYTTKAEEIINCIRNTKKWKLPSLERFIYDLGIR